MKKLFLVLLAIFTSVFMLTACGEEKQPEPEQVNQKPVIVGQDEVTLTVGERFVAMSYITSATDAEDGDVKENVEVSGSFDTTKPGDYVITYSVKDSANQTATHTLTLHVVALDEEAPSITGAGDVDAIAGVPFDVASGVKAIDGKDGDVTSKMTITGAVDVQKPGTYQVTYKVADAAGNIKEITRKVTVKTLPFYYNEEDEVKGSTVTFTHDAQSKYAYDIVMVKVKVANAENDVNVTLNGVSIKASSVEASGEDTIATVWFKVDAALTDAPITCDNGTVESWTLGDAADVVAPTITGDFTDAVVISKDHKEATVSFIVKMCGAQAQDDRDGFITDKIATDLEAINWDSKEEQTITISVADAAGNETTQQVKVIVAQETELADLLEIDIDGLVKGSAADSHPSFGLADLYRNADIAFEAEGADKGSLHISNVSSGGYWSFGMIRYVLNGNVTPGNYYVLKITARAGLEASEGQLTQGISFRIGEQINAAPWYYEFKGGSVGGSDYAENRISLTQEYQTFYVIFKAEKRDGTDLTGEEALAMEFHFTPKEWVTVYDTYVKEFSLSLLSNEDQKPLLTETGVSKLLVVNQEFDPKDYMTASDVEDGDLTSVITVEGTPDLSKAGIFTLTYKVKDSAQHEVSKEVSFEVFTEPDTTKPTITFDGANPLELVIDSMTTEQAMELLASKLSVKDTKNGAEYTIGLEDCTITSTVDLTKAGKYKVTVTAKDSSGNVGTLDIVVRVVKEEASDSQYDLVADLMSGFNGSKESLNWTLADGVLTLEATGEIGGWGSANKSKLENFCFEVGKKYHFEVEAKADAARKVAFNWSATESSWSTYGSVGKIEAELGTSFEKYSVDFVFTGKFSKNDSEYDVAYYALELQLGHFDWAAGESLDNKVYIKSMAVYEIVEKPTEKVDLVADLMSGFNGTKESLDWTLADGVLTLQATGEIGGWGSANKSKIENACFEVGKTYRFVVEAKADAARKVAFSWAAAESSWTNYGSVGKIEAELGTSFEIFSVDFVYTGKFTKNETEYDVAYYALELQLGHIDWSAGETLDNKVYIKQIAVYEVTPIEEPTEKVDLIADLMQGFNGTKESLDWTLADGVLTLQATGEIGGWGSANKSKLENFCFEVGKTYRFLVEAKADVARKVAFSWAAAESTWTNYGSVGKIEAELGTEYEIYSVDFVFTGKFTKNEIEYVVAYYALELQLGHFDSTAAESLDNKVYIKQMAVYEVTPIEKEPEYGDLVANMMVSSKAKADGGIHTIENATIAMDGEIAVITPDASITANQWASNNKLKYGSIQDNLEMGKTYRLVLVAKADVARKMQLSLVPNWVGGNAIKQVLELGTDFEALVWEFTLTEAFNGANIDLEFQFGQINYEASATADNKIYVKSFALYEVESEGGDPTPQTVEYNALTGTAYSDASAVTFTPNQDGSVTCAAPKEKWFGVKNLSVPAGVKYFVLVVSSDVEGTTLRYKLDDSANSKDSKKTTVDLDGETTIVIDIEEYGIAVADIVKVVLWNTNQATANITIKSATFTSVNPNPAE